MIVASGQQMNHDSWQKFFEGHRDFQNIQSEQRARGLNDYNLMSALLKVHDEVRLHSRFLYSFLNPRGHHYQGALFLRMFLEVIGLDKTINADVAEVYRERDNIDLYITDGEHHVIVENKVHALDQKWQIKRYIEQIKSDSQAEPGDITVVYLSKNRKSPSRIGLGSLFLQGEPGSLYLCDKEHGGRKVANYLNIHYSAGTNNGCEILTWVEQCKREVTNLTNLRFALEQYEDVVHRLNKTYKSGIMTFEEFLTNDPEAADEYVIQAASIHKAMPGLYARWLENAMFKGMQELVSGAEGGAEPVELNEENCPELTEYFFAPGDAKRFFSPQEKSKNKGVFWAMPNRLGEVHYALTLIFGKSAIHVGVIPLKANEGGGYEIDPAGSKKALELIERSEIIAGTFSEAKHWGWVGLVSYAKKLQEEIVHLRNFEKSKQFELARELIKTFSQAGR